MTFTLDLTPETVARLEEQAGKEGVGVQDLARRFIETALPIQVKNGTETDHAERVRATRGKFAHFGVSTQDLLDERRQETEREERQFQEPTA